MSVCVFVCSSVSLFRLRERVDGFAQFFLEVVGKVQGVSAKYLKIITTSLMWCMLNARKYILSEHIAQIAFISIISMGIVCNEYRV